MPPEDAEKQLSDDERQVLNRWISEGGKYATHWSFVSPQKRIPSGVENAAKAEIIDAFVAAHLQRAGARFRAGGRPQNVGARAALVLTGLPPEPDILADFLADKRPDAYERLVDRLLASPRFGEHQARYWLDADPIR